MSRYDGLIIPRSYSEYINKTDAATLLQALQQSGVMDAAPTENSNHPVKSGGVFTAAAAIAASNTTITGAAITAGAIVRIFFSTDINGSDTTTGLSISYNGTTYAVKVIKDRLLKACTAYEIASGSYKYLQANTVLELYFDGEQFIIINNPVVLSNANITVYADGIKTKSVPNYGNFLGLPVDTFARYAGFSTEKDTYIKDSNAKEIFVATYKGTSTAGAKEIQLPSDVQNIIKIEGCINQANGTFITPLTYYFSNTDYCRWYFIKTNKRLVLEAGSQNGYGEYMIRIFYTKS